MYRTEALMLGRQVCLAWKLLTHIHILHKTYLFDQPSCVKETPLCELWTSNSPCVVVCSYFLCRCVCVYMYMYIYLSSSDGPVNTHNHMSEEHVRKINESCLLSMISCLKDVFYVVESGDQELKRLLNSSISGIYLATILIIGWLLK